MTDRHGGSLHGQLNLSRRHPLASVPTHVREAGRTAQRSRGLWSLCLANIRSPRRIRAGAAAVSRNRMRRWKAELQALG